MTEPVGTPEDAAAAARAAEQVRLRKERREAKIKAGGANRLSKITGLGGGLQRDPDPQPQQQQPQSSQPPTQSSTPPPPYATSASSAAPPNPDDPEEVDISQHYYAPSTTARVPTAGPSLNDAQLRQMMLGFEQPPPGSNGAAPGPQMPPGMGAAEEDPMMKALMQMMGGGVAGGGGGPGGNNPFAGMEGLFGPGGPGAVPGMQQAQGAVAMDQSANVWRVVHAVFALGLGLYVAMSTTFTGTKTERDYSTLSAAPLGQKPPAEQNLAATGPDGGIDQTRAYFFYLFTSVEAVLLTTRLVLDKNRAPPSGIMWSVSGFLPARFRTGVRHVLRYGQIFSTVRSDALVCVFVLGVCCWLRSS